MGLTGIPGVWAVFLTPRAWSICEWCCLSSNRFTLSSSFLLIWFSLSITKFLLFSSFYCRFWRFLSLSSRSMVAKSLLNLSKATHQIILTIHIVVAFIISGSMDDRAHRTAPYFYLYGYDAWGYLLSSMACPRLALWSTLWVFILPLNKINDSLIKNQNHEWKLDYLSFNLSRTMSGNLTASLRYFYRNFSYT